MVQLYNQRTVHFVGTPAARRVDTSCNLRAFVTDESDGSRKYITLEQALTLAKASEKTPSTVGDLADPSKRVVNVEARDSQLSQNTFYFQVTPQKPLADRPASHIEITDDFEFVQYGVGGHFSEHEDRSLATGIKCSTPTLSASIRHRTSLAGIFASRNTRSRCPAIVGWLLSLRSGCHTSRILSLLERS